jgi:hypothetical protein
VRSPLIIYGYAWFNQRHSVSTSETKYHIMKTLKLIWVRLTLGVSMQTHDEEEILINESGMKTENVYVRNIPTLPGCLPTGHS